MNSEVLSPSSRLRLSLRRVAPLLTLATYFISRISAPYNEEARNDAMAVPGTPLPIELKTASLPPPPAAPVSVADYIGERRKQPSWHLYAGLPRATSGRSLIILTNIGYICGYDQTRKSPAWVAYRLFKISDDAGKGLKRRDYFAHDDRVAQSPSSNPLARTGYDHGHMAPNLSIGTRYGQRAQDETFLMTDICPQLPHFNRVIYRTLEARQRNHAQWFDEVWIVAGPVYDRTSTFVSKDQIEIPDRFFNFEIDEVDGARPRLRSVAVCLPHEVRDAQKFKPYLVSINEIEKLTELDFNCVLPDSIEAELERSIAPEIWERASNSR